MADAQDVVADLRAHFDTEIHAVVADLPILGDNEPALGAEGSAYAKPDSRTGEWVRISIQVGSGQLASINENISDDPGRIVVMIFTPLGTGSDRAYELRDLVRNIFQGRRIGAAYCRATQTTGYGSSPDNLWFQLNASTAFRFESTPA